jgi:quercetin dioxygenase-like cupin family protein
LLKKSLIAAAVAAPAVAVTAFAQQSGIKRTPLQTVDFPAGYNVVTAIAEVPPGYCKGRHTHPGVESTYVMEGAILVKIEGQPDKVFKAGESSQVPPNDPTTAARCQPCSKCSEPTSSKRASRWPRLHRKPRWVGKRPARDQCMATVPPFPTLSASPKLALPSACGEPLALRV